MVAKTSSIINYYERHSLVQYSFISFCFRLCMLLLSGLYQQVEVIQAIDLCVPRKLLLENDRGLHILVPDLSCKRLILMYKGICNVCQHRIVLLTITHFQPSVLKMILSGKLDIRPTHNGKSHEKCPYFLEYLSQSSIPKLNVKLWWPLFLALKT